MFLRFLSQMMLKYKSPQTAMLSEGPSAPPPPTFHFFERTVSLSLIPENISNRMMPRLHRSTPAVQPESPSTSTPAWARLFWSSASGARYPSVWMYLTSWRRKGRERVRNTIPSIPRVLVVGRSNPRMNPPGFPLWSWGRSRWAWSTRRQHSRECCVAWGQRGRSLPCEGRREPPGCLWHSAGQATWSGLAGVCQGNTVIRT